MSAIRVKDCKPECRAEIETGIEGHWTKASWERYLRINPGTLTHYDLHKANFSGLYHHRGLNQVEYWEHGKRLWAIKMIRA